MTQHIIALAADLQQPIRLTQQAGEVIDQPGFDTDCNGATAGSILGMRLGAQGVPPAWTGRFHDTLETGLVGMPTVKVSEMAAWTYGVHRKVLES